MCLWVLRDLNIQPSETACGPHFDKEASLLNCSTETCLDLSKGVSCKTRFFKCYDDVI